MIRPPPTQRSARFAASVLLCIVSLFATILLQRWIGAITVYAPELEKSRLELHAAILTNRPPDGRTWESLGARNTNTRVATVLLADWLHRATGMTVIKAYFVIDTVALWFSLLLLFVLLRQWVDPTYCVIGILYFVSVLPLTYLFYFFHPWDRISQCLWILVFLCIKRDWYVGLALSLAASMVVKYDTVPVPAIYWLANVTRTTLWPVTLRAVVLLAIALGVLYGLVSSIPGGASGPMTPDGAIAVIVGNSQAFGRMNLFYPPLLLHLVPTVLALVGWSRADRAARAGVVIGLGCLVPLWFVGSNFHEVRAQVPLTILLFPAALLGAQRLLEKLPSAARR